MVRIGLCRRGQHDAQNGHRRDRLNACSKPWRQQSNTRETQQRLHFHQLEDGDIATCNTKKKGKDWSHWECQSVRRGPCTLEVEAVPLPRVVCIPQTRRDKMTARADRMHGVLNLALPYPGDECETIGAVDWLAQPRHHS